MRPALLVLSWEPGLERETVRVDGYYFDDELAFSILRFNHENGRRAMLVKLLADTVRSGGIPDALFAIAPKES